MERKSACGGSRGEVDRGKVIEVIAQGRELVVGAPGGCQRRSKPPKARLAIPASPTFEMLPRRICGVDTASKMLLVPFTPVSEDKSCQTD